MSNDYKVEKFLNNFAAHLAATRRNSGITQEKLAELANMDRVALANIETGKRRPTLTTVFKISKALKIPLSELFKQY